jgi:hypothetical protein
VTEKKRNHDIHPNFLREVVKKIISRALRHGFLRRQRQEALFKGSLSYIARHCSLFPNDLEMFRVWNRRQGGDAWWRRQRLSMC